MPSRRRRGKEEDDDDNDDDDDEAGDQDNVNPESVIKRTVVYEEEDESAFHVESIESVQSKIDRSSWEGKSYEEGEEGLGEDFENTPWKPPNLDKSGEFKAFNVFRQGTAEISEVKVTNAPDLGEGVSLYFLFLKAFAWYFFFCFFLSIPLMVFAFFGSGIKEQDKDALMLYRFTLGNIGYDKNSVSYSSDSACKSAANIGGNSTCIHIGEYYEMTLNQASNIITALEFLQIIGFLIVIRFLRKKTDLMKKTNEVLKTSVSDYSIYVTDLPPDISTEQIISHFSNLYPLNKPDWKRRPAVLGARPVIDTTNSGNVFCKDTWIAEVVIHKKIGGFIRAFKEQQHKMGDLYSARARMKMYADNTPHARGPNKRKHMAAEQDMLKCAVEIDNLTAREMKKNKIRLKDNEHDTETAKKIKDPQYNLDAPAVAAFVCFEYSESMARCIEDYQKYDTFPFSLCYPSELKLRGHRVKVHKAPEPDSIVWENLEISKLSKFLRKAFTNIVTLVLLIICFAVILQACILKSQFNDQVPDLSLCLKDIPEMYASNFTDDDTLKGFNYESWRYARPTKLSDRKTQDSECQKYFKGSFYTHMTMDGDYTSDPYGYYIGRVNYSHTHCTDNGICPSKRQAFCPCISTSSREECKTVACDINPNSKDCKTYEAGTLGACFCMTQLLDTFANADNILGAMATIKELMIDPTCSSFYSNYSQSIGFSYLSIVITVVVNKFLLWALSRLTLKEGHFSVDAEQGHLMYKVFLSTYFNMAVLIIIASGKINGLPSLVQMAHIFQGNYSDFDSAWYGNIATYFIITFIIQSLSPIFMKNWGYYVSRPCITSCIYPHVASQNSYAVVRQAELDALEVGPIFDVTSSQAQVLTLLFFCMTYCGGIPILVPLCGITFAWFFRIDKILLLRYNQRPPQLGDQTMRIILFIIPYAAVIRCCISIWMFGNDDVLSSTVAGSASVGGVSTDSYSNILGGSIAMAEMHGVSSNIILMLKRIGKPTVFPIFILLILIVAYNVIDALWDKLPIFWIMKFISCLLKIGKNNNKIYADNPENVEGNKDANGNIINTVFIKPYDIQKLEHELRQEIAPFTGEYFKILKDKNEIPPLTCCNIFQNKNSDLLSQREIEDDWEIADRGDYIMKIKPWNQTVTVGGQSHIKGDPKRTYEIINEHSCSSYSLDKIPAYKLAVQGLLQGVKSLMEDKDMATMGSELSIKDKFLNKKFQDANKPEENIWANKDEDWGANKKNDDDDDDDDYDNDNDDDDDDDEDGDDDSDGSGLV